MRSPRFAFSKVADSLYHLTFDDFCDWYAEAIKPRLYDGDADAQATALAALERLLQLLHPVMPHVTEEIWTHLPARESRLIVVAVAGGRRTFRRRRRRARARAVGGDALSGAARCGSSSTTRSAASSRRSSSRARSTQDGSLERGEWSGCEGDRSRRGHARQRALRRERAGRRRRRRAREARALPPRARRPGLALSASNAPGGRRQVSNSPPPEIA